MSDDEQARVQGQPAVSDREPSPADLAASLRRHRIQLIVFTVVVAIGAGIVVGGALLFTLAPFVVGDMEMRGASVQETRKEFLSEWGARTESLDVREVKAEYPDLDVPSFLSGALPTEKAVYVECRLRKPDVLIADVVYEAYDMGALDEGLLPSPPSPARFCGGGSLQQRASDAEDVLRTVYR